MRRRVLGLPIIPVTVLLLTMAVALSAGCSLVRDTTSEQSPGDSAARGESADPRTEEVAFTLGTVVRIVALGEEAADAVPAAIAEMHRLSPQFDRFDPRGDIGRLNAAAGAWSDLAPETAQLLQEALRLADLTDGAFDPTITPLVDLWGFVEVEEGGADGLLGGPIDNPSSTTMRGSSVPPAEAIQQALQLVDYHDVIIDATREAARLERAGQQIDLGGIAKGYGADRAAEILRSRGVRNALIDMGGDVVAMGGRGAGPWRLGLRHPRSNDIMAVLHVEDQAVATSGDYERFFEVDGVRYSHIIDPATGWPADTLMSVTIVAPTGVVADALATAVFALGMEAGQALIDTLPDVEGILVAKNGERIITDGLEGKVEFF